MYMQNPVFIPGPTNMPEVLRRAADMPTLDHRSPRFAEILHPALAGVRKVIKSASAEELEAAGEAPVVLGAVTAQPGVAYVHLDEWHVA